MFFTIALLTAMVLVPIAAIIIYGVYLLVGILLVFIAPLLGFPIGR